MSLLSSGSHAMSGNTEGLQDVASTWGAERDHAAKYGAAMSAQKLSIGGVCGVGGLRHQGQSCAQWRAKLVLEVTLPGVPRLVAAKKGLSNSGCWQSA